MSQTHVHRLRHLCLVLRIGSLIVISSIMSVVDTIAAADFERDVAPIFVRRCLECHNSSEASGKLTLQSRDGLIAGGESGDTINLADPAKSLLLDRIRSGEMPPPKAGKSRQLPDSEIAILSEWIREGAKWPTGRTLDQFERTLDSRAGRDWWSFQPIQHPPIPAPPNDTEDHNPIDAFVESALAAKGWQFAPTAEKPVLIRRLYNDLLGLTPTFEQIESFVKDESPSAYENLVDELLASPHFGERWGRHWLDVVRFAETCGYERDQEKPNAWRYREWVIQAFNDDKPFDQFVVEQLAGDELPNRTESTVIGTGFLRLGTWNDEPNDPQEYKYERMEDMIHATSVAFLGLTIKCARCHDHKFDPIPQTDYYRVANAFWAGFIEPGSGKVQGGPDTSQLGFDVLGWTDRSPTPPPLHLLKKGDPNRAAEVIEPGNPTFISVLSKPIASPPSDAKTTHRRSQLANWIVDPKNPLTARVWANRIWQRHFGAGLVASPDNFGFAAGKPSHPELLDWLASEILGDGWQSKRIHRLIVTSRAYRQSSSHPKQAEYEQDDPANRWLWRIPRRRLDAESLRDSLLFASRRLDCSRIGGPSYYVDISADALEGLSMKGNAWKASPSVQQNRRAIYSFTKRGLLPPLMTTFDFSDTTLPCGQRDVTTVAPQALALLNNSFIHQQSETLAKQLATANRDPKRQIEMAWKQILGRSPRAEEVTEATDHLKRQAARFKERGRVVPTREEIAGPVLHLQADRGLILDNQRRVAEWSDQSGSDHHAFQQIEDARPTLVPLSWSGRATVRFSGEKTFLNLAGQVVSSQQFTIAAVIEDRTPATPSLAGTAPGHREIFSNWDGSHGNSVTSLFFGMTGQSAVRVSDDFSGVGEIRQRERPFVLSVVVDEHSISVFQNDTQIAKRGSTLSNRNLTTPYVVGTQGNFGHEYWNGDLGELLVFDRALNESQRGHLVSDLMRRHGISAEPDVLTPDELALASLCHVLLNTNEFLYVD